MMRLPLNRRGWAWAGLGLIAAMVIAGPVHAMQSVEFASKMEVEKPITGADGKVTTSYGPTEIVVPGDRIRFTLQLVNKTDVVAKGLKIVDPLPAEVRFDSTADITGFSVSVDGGKNYGSIESLTVPIEGAAPRAASVDDITHLRWILDQPLAAGATKAVTFFGIIR